MERGPRPAPPGGRQVLPAARPAARSRAPTTRSPSAPTSARSSGARDRARDLGRVRRVARDGQGGRTRRTTRSPTAGSNPTPLGALLNVARPTSAPSAAGATATGVQWDADAEEFVYAGATDEYRDLVEYFARPGRGRADGPRERHAGRRPGDPEVRLRPVVRDQHQRPGDAAVPHDHRRARAHRREFAKIRVPAGPAGDTYSGQPPRERHHALQRRAPRARTSSRCCSSSTGCTTPTRAWSSPSGASRARRTRRRPTASARSTTTSPASGLNPGAPEHLQVDYGFYNGVFMLAHGSTIELVQSHAPTRSSSSWQEKMADQGAPRSPPPYPLDEIEREQVSLYQTALTDYVEEHAAVHPRAAPARRVGRLRRRARGHEHARRTWTSSTAPTSATRRRTAEPTPPARPAPVGRRRSRARRTVRGMSAPREPL